MARRDVEVRVSGRYAELLQGYITVADLDDEELARGKLRDKNGDFRGGQPNMLPVQMVDAMRNELYRRANENLQAALMGPGIKTLVDLATGSVDDKVRLKAATTIIERMMGKVPDRVKLSAEDPVEKLFRDILADPHGLAPTTLPEVLPEPSPDPEEDDILG